MQSTDLYSFETVIQKSINTDFVPLHPLLFSTGNLGGVLSSGRSRFLRAKKEKKFIQFQFPRIAPPSFDLPFRPVWDNVLDRLGVIIESRPRASDFYQSLLFD